MHSTFRLAARLLASFSLLLFLAPAGVRADDEASALLAKHRAFVGWEFGDGSLQSWRLSTASGTGDRKTTSTQIRRGSLYHNIYGSGDLSSDAGFTGRAFWDSDENGNAVTLYEDSVRYAVSQNALFDEATTGLPGTSRGTAKIGDANVHVVRVTPPSGFPVDLYIQDDGAYRRAVIDDGEFKTEINIEKYADALPGKKIISLYRYGTGSPREIVKIEPNVAVSDADLLPPQPRTHWDFNSTDPMPISVVIHDVGGAVQILASVNGHEGRFLLDSGSSGTLLFTPFADKVEAEDLGDSAISGVNGENVKAKRIRVKDLALGKNVLHNVVMETATLADRQDVDGLIGFDVLAQAIVDVDLVGHKLSILDPAHFTPKLGKGAAAFPVDLSSRQPAAHIVVANGIDVKPIFDTGNQFDVLLSERLRTSGKVVATVNSYQPLYGVDGRSNGQVACSRLTQMRVGPYPYENAQVCFGDPNVYGVKDGLIGFDFLKHFNWTFDYPDGKLILTPNGMR